MIREEILMERIATNSRDIAIIGYDKKTATLEITFRSGGVYHYSQVPEDVYQKLMSAPSQGTFFSEKIKNQYPYKKIS